MHTGRSGGQAKRCLMMLAFVGLTILAWPIPGTAQPPSFTAQIPMLSEWGMILLVLSLLTVGTWRLAGRPALFVATTVGGGLLPLPSLHLLRFVLIGQGVAGLGLLLYGRLISPLVAHDVIGAALSGVLLGLMLECSRPGRARSTDRHT